MPSWKKCFFKCPSGDSLFTFPSDVSTREKWSEFVFGDQPPSVKNPFVCARHFTDDCFLNKSLYVSGQVARLALRPGAAPSLKTRLALTPGAAPSLKTRLALTPGAAPSLKTVSLTTESRPWPKPEPTEHVLTTWAPVSSVKSSRSVSTQLSTGTLRQQHYRSKAVQTVITTVRAPEVLTGTWPQLSPENSSTCGAKGAKKRPREEEEEEKDEDEEDEGEEEEEESALLNSPYKPTDSDSESELPHFTEMEPEDDDEERFLVFESCLRELFETCPGCKHLCSVHKRTRGTLVEFTQACSHCLYSRRWQSQPLKQDCPTTGPRAESGPIPIFYWPQNDSDK